MQTVVEASSRGDAEAFEQLYSMLVGKVFGYLVSRTDRTSATDLTQDSFVELYKALPSFVYHNDIAFHSFVFIIVKRVLAKHYNNKHTKVATTTTELDEAMLEGEARNATEELDVTAALATLDDTTREIMVLHHWSRYTFPEIAALIDMNESAVRTRHHRALSQLAAHLTSS